MSAAPPALLPRHALVWPATAARSALLSQTTDADARASMARWLDAGWPLVVRRPDPPVFSWSSRVHLGLPLPPGRGKRRLAFVLARDDVARAAPPPSLQWVSAALPGAWRRASDDLDRDARALGVTLRAFGSAAWQALTGLDYLREGSDVDVLFRPASQAQLDATLASFAAWEARTDLRVDAEILFDGERAVAWREWRQASGTDDRVLAKSLAGVALVRRDELLAPLAPMTA